MKRIVIVLGLGLVCLGSQAVPRTAVITCSIDTRDGAGGPGSAGATAALNVDARDYALQVSSAAGNPVPGVGAHTYAWRSSVTCSVEQAIQIVGGAQRCTGWSVEPGGGASGNEVILKLYAPDTHLNWQWQTVATGDGDGDGFDDAWEALNGLIPGQNESGIVDYITNHDSAFGLYTSNAILDLSFGDLGLAVAGGYAELDLQLEQSEDLQNWTNAGPVVEWSMPVDGNTKFYRVRALTNGIPTP